MVVGGGRAPAAAASANPASQFGFARVVAFWAPLPAELARANVNTFGGREACWRARLAHSLGPAPAPGRPRLARYPRARARKQMVRARANAQAI